MVVFVNICTFLFHVWFSMLRALFCWQGNCDMFINYPGASTGATHIHKKRKLDPSPQVGQVCSPLPRSIAHSTIFSSISPFDHFPPLLIRFHFLDLLIRLLFTSSIHSTIVLLHLRIRLFSLPIRLSTVLKIYFYTIRPQFYFI